MSTSPTRIRRPARKAARIALAIGVAQALLTGAPARAQTDAIVGVHAGHYAMAGRSYLDLDKLESAVRENRPAEMRIAWCDDATARAWLAVVARFGELPVRFDAGDSACGPVPLPASARAVATPGGIDDVAVARYWNRRMP